MIEAIVTTETAQATTPGKKQPARDDVAAGFSFAAAMTALEGRASQSLKTFGAASQSGGVMAPSQGQQAGQKPASQSKTDASADNDKSAGKKTAEAPQSQTTQNAPAKAQAAQAPAPQTPSQAQPVVAAAAAAVIAPAQPAPAQASTARIESAALRGVETTKTGAAKVRTLAAPKPVQAPTQDFAKLLARRLDSGATSFELRLDPPQLGRVEAHLKLGDDGQSTLALKFDNPATLNLFANDEAALRASLMSSGFNLGGEQLAFSLRDDAGAAVQPAGAAVETLAYEPLFLAPYSQGAVDLRV